METINARDLLQYFMMCTLLFLHKLSSTQEGYCSFAPYVTITNKVAYVTINKI